MFTKSSILGILRDHAKRHLDSCSLISAELTSIRHPEDECSPSGFQKESSGWCGLSLKSMFGTRDAAANRAAIVMDTLTTFQFEVVCLNIRACANTLARTSDCSITAPTS